MIILRCRESVKIELQYYIDLKKKHHYQSAAEL